MLGLIVLVALQFAIALLGAPKVMEFIAIKGDLALFAKAAAYAVIVWIVALVGAFALKDVNVPSSKTLAAALVCAAIGAALTLIPQVMSFMPINVPKDYFPLIGAIIGYMIKRT